MLFVACDALFSFVAPMYSEDLDEDERSKFRLHTIKPDSSTIYFVRIDKTAVLACLGRCVYKVAVRSVCKNGV